MSNKQIRSINSVHCRRCSHPCGVDNERFHCRQESSKQSWLNALKGSLLP